MEADVNNIDFTDTSIYHIKYIDKSYFSYQDNIKIEDVLAKFKSNKNIFTIYLSDISKILKCLYDKQSSNSIVLHNASDFFLDSNNIKDFKELIFNLSLIRNAIAHHHSFLAKANELKFNHKRQNVRNILGIINDVLTNIRESDTPSDWIVKVENLLESETENHINLRQYMGYKTDFSNRIQPVNN